VAAEVHQFTATIPANTPVSAPVTVPISLSYWSLESVDLEVPPGPSGLMGFYLARSGQQWIPYEAGEWLVWDDRFDSWTLTNQPTGEGWQVVGYNLDVYPHDVVVRFHVNIIAPASLLAPPVPTFVTSGTSYSPVVV
jgi:hypothetical protein